MIDLPHSLTIRRELPYCLEAEMRGVSVENLTGTGFVCDEAQGIIPTPEEYDPAQDATDAPEPQMLWVVAVPSSNPANKPYAVTGWENGAVTCECPGFTHRGKCRHTAIGVEEYQALEMVSDAAPEFNLSFAEAREIIRRERAERAAAAMDDLYGPVKAA